MTIFTRLLGADSTHVSRTELDALVLEVVDRALVRASHLSAFTSAAWARRRDVAADILEELYSDAERRTP